MFRVGDKVRWKPRAAGYFKVKKGKVIAVIPVGEVARPQDWLFHRCMFDGDGGPRNHESYLIEVPGGKTGTATPKLYWPRVSQLRKVEE